MATALPTRLPCTAQSAAGTHQGTPNSVSQGDGDACSVDMLLLPSPTLWELPPSLWAACMALEGPFPSGPQPPAIVLLPGTYFLVAAVPK